MNKHNGSFKKIAKPIRDKKHVQSSLLSIAHQGLMQKKAMPRNIKPMLAKLTEKAFDDPGWLFEIKWDGYRAIAEIDNGKVNLHSRNNLSFNENFASIVKSLEQIKNKVIFDGEIVVLDKNGKSDFQLLQDFQRTGKGSIAYYIFDILYLDGYDLTKLTQLERKQILKEFLPQLKYIRYGDHVIAKGKEFFKVAKNNKLEGIMAKRSASTYQINKRSSDWLKIKTHLRQEAVIGGFTKPRGSRNNFGALVLGVYERGGALHYIGHTGTGFDENTLVEVMRKLQPLITKNSPFKHIPKTNMPATWVKPKLICEISFAEWTYDGNMRQPVFIGLREDKNPKDVKREFPENSIKKITHKARRA